MKSVDNEIILENVHAPTLNNSPKKQRRNINISTRKISKSTSKIFRGQKKLNQDLFLYLDD